MFGIKISIQVPIFRVETLPTFFQYFHEQHKFVCTTDLMLFHHTPTHVGCVSVHMWLCMCVLQKNKK